MKKALTGLVLAATLLAGGPAQAYDDGGDQGNGNDQRRCAHSGDNCRNWSPTFDKSPVDISHNQFCVMPGSCTGNDGDKKEQEPASSQRPQSIACLVPFPYHCDPKPAGFFPPNPAKIPGQIQAFVKLTFDFVQGVLTFAI